MRIKLNEASTIEVIACENLFSCALQLMGTLDLPFVALSGGSTFAKLFDAWSANLTRAPHGSFYPVDERMVPFGDSQSNWTVAYERFFRPMGLEGQKNHFADSVDSYRKLLQKALGRKMRFSAVMLGVGDDGHTASLFPGGEYLDDENTWVLQTSSPKPPTDRISISPRMIAQAQKCDVVLFGENKKEIFKRIEQNDEALPIVSVLRRRKLSTLYIDQSFIQ